MASMIFLPRCSCRCRPRHSRVVIFRYGFAVHDVEGSRFGFLVRQRRRLEGHRLLPWMVPIGQSDMVLTTRLVPVPLMGYRARP